MICYLNDSLDGCVNGWSVDRFRSDVTIDLNTLLEKSTPSDTLRPQIIAIVVIPDGG